MIPFNSHTLNKIKKLSLLMAISLSVYFISFAKSTPKENAKTKATKTESTHQNENNHLLKVRKKFPRYRVYYRPSAVIQELQEAMENPLQNASPQKP